MGGGEAREFWKKNFPQFLQKKNFSLQFLAYMFLHVNNRKNKVTFKVSPLMVGYSNISTCKKETCKLNEVDKK